MKRNEAIAIALVFLATIVPVLGIFAFEKYKSAKLYTVELIARTPLNGNWYPKEFKVPFGKEVTLRIRNIETVSHGFALPDFRLEPAINEIKAGEVKVVKFIADKRGVFPFMCTVWCSDEHMQMNGEITVE